MRGARFGLGEAYGGATLDGLPDGEVALAIGLKRNAVVRGPGRKPVVPSERESPHRARARQLKAVDGRLITIIYPEGDVGAVWRYSWRHVRK